MTPPDPAASHLSGTTPLPAGLRPGGRFAEWTRRRPGYVVADVDGTLIHEGTTATRGVADAVAAAAAAGLRVGFATGRLPAGLTDLDAQLRLPGPHVVHNGAQVRESGRPLHTWPLDRAVAQQLVQWCLDVGAYAELNIGDQFVVTERRPEAESGWTLISGPPHGLASDIDWTTTDLIKATVTSFQGEQLSELLAGLGRMALVAEASTSPVFPGDTFINVTSPAADKGKAVSWVAEYLGLDLEQVVAIGDGPNDLSMLAAAGTAIAMGQAPQAVLDRAHLIVPEVDADGVAHALDAAVHWLAAP